MNNSTSEMRHPAFSVPNIRQWNVLIKAAAIVYVAHGGQSSLGFICSVAPHQWCSCWWSCLFSAVSINWSEEHLGSCQQRVWPHHWPHVWGRASRMITEEMGGGGGNGGWAGVSGSRAGGHSYVTPVMSDHHIRWDPPHYPPFWMPFSLYIS